MIRSFYASTIAFVLVLGTTAQLYGCDTVQCPRYANDSVLCDLGNDFIVSELGIANISSFVSGANFTYTVAADSKPNPTNGSITTYTVIEEVYLGVPSGTDLTNPPNSLVGCTIVLFSQPSNLTSPANTCLDAIGVQCTNDLENAATAAMASLAARGTTGSTLCDQLQAQIVSQRPTSCTAVGVDVSIGFSTGMKLQFIYCLLTPAV